MKKNLIIIIFCLLSQLVFGELILELTDPLGDDYGAGSVTYPEHPMFEDGIFDISSFKIFKEDGEYIFTITVAGKIKPVRHAEFEYNYNIPRNFILPLIQIYIDTDHVSGSGITETINGTRVQISPENGWERAVVFTSLSDRFSAAVKKKHPQLVSRIYISSKIDISKDKHEISVVVPENFLGEVSSDWGFTVLMMGHDFSQTIQKNIYVTEVKSTAGQFNFGGGDVAMLKRYSPNIIDLITPPLHPQEEMLQNYDKDKEAYATVQAVYPNGAQLKKKKVFGEVKQVSKEKVVINLGSSHGITKDTKLLIDNKYVVIAEDIFPELTIASFANEDDWNNIRTGMKVSIWKE